MSSVVRSFAVRKESLTRFVKPESPCYYDDDEGNSFLFPFSYSNQVLDILYADNKFKSIMVDISNNTPSNETNTIVRIMGGPYLVTSVGDNFKAYIRAWLDGEIDNDSPINVYIASQMLRVQEASLANINAGGSSYVKHDSAPTGEDYISGNTTNNYNTTYIFKTPLTISYVASSVTKYVTFKSVLDQE